MSPNPAGRVAYDRSRESPASQPPASISSQSNHFSWAWTCAGMGLFAFGSVLTCWYTISGRLDLWRIGLPSLLLGQAILMFNMLLRLERLRQTQP